MRCTNPGIVAILLKRGAEPEPEDSLKLTPLELIQMRSGFGTKEERLIDEYIAKKKDGVYVEPNDLSHPERIRPIL